MHRFQPAHYHNTLGPHEPVLRIADGDTVITHTIDAHGVDREGNRVGERPNPLTGPFYIEGAEPGDTLAVHFDRLAPDRDTGFTYTPVAPNVVEPGFVRQMPERRRLLWHIDRQHQVATLAEPTPGLENLVLSLAPMLGCFGVAPAGGQAISTMTSGEHGGNMDYRRFVAGSTVYLPVFVPGALFCLGDGHATQGDGEIVGTGIETSFEVEFTVHVLKGRTIGWPRGEDADYIFTIGNARPLDQAVQHATTEMLRWLTQDFGLDIAEASTLLGQCVEYDLGNIYDPAYTMVCKVPKRILAAIERQ
ncbi:MAG: acetamidase/formamidase family protein [Anaerolineae bacterium]